jgi:hypothetical protein
LGNSLRHQLGKCQKKWGSWWWTKWDQKLGNSLRHQLGKCRKEWGWWWWWWWTKREWDHWLSLEDCGTGCDWQPNDVFCGQGYQWGSKEQTERRGVHIDSDMHGCKQPVPLPNPSLTCKHHQESLGCGIAPLTWYNVRNN